MNVQALIEKLKECDLEAEVMLRQHEDLGTYVEALWTVEASGSWVVLDI